MRRFWARCRSLFDPAAEREMSREMESHVAMLQEEFERRGLACEEARMEARRAYGNFTQSMELHREARTFLWLEQVCRDVLYGIRVLLLNPGFTAVAILSLALGIGANTVIFSLLDTTLLRPLGYQDPGKLVAIWTVPKGHPEQMVRANAASYLAWQERAKSPGSPFASMGAFFGFESSLGRDENGAPAERIEGQFVSPSLFATLGVAPADGRAFAEQEGTPVAFAPVTQISQRLWESRFGRDPQILGKSMELDGVKTTIVGVMPAGFNLFAEETDYWAVSGITRQRLESSGPLLEVVARLKPGVSIKQAQAAMDQAAAEVSKDDPSHNDGNGARVQPLQEAFLGRFRNPLLLLQGAVAFVLLIGCANVAGLLLARGATRQNEIAVRSAVGAGRWRIVRQLLTESVVLAAAGGMLGVALAWGGLQLFISSAPPGFPRLNELRLDVPVLVFTAVIALVTGVLFGLVPAIQISRPDLIEALKATRGGGASSLIRQRFRSVLVTLQVALALMLLIGAGLMINSFLRIQNNRLGMDPHDLLTFQFRYPALQVMKPIGKYRNNGLYEVNPGVSDTIERMADRLRLLPGAESVAAASGGPVGGAISMKLRVTGGTLTGIPRESARAMYLAVTPNYFSTLKTPIVRGRDFTQQDSATGSRVVIVNESLASLYWPGQNPLGQSLVIDYLPGDPPREVVAVVGDVKISQTQQNVQPMIYVPLPQQGAQWVGPALFARAGAFFIVRASNPKSLIPAARRAIAQIDTTQPLNSIQTVEETLSGEVQYTRLYVLLLGIFGGSAALLAAVGIYGVMSFSIAQRRREIGIRMALGASRHTVLRLIARQALSMIGGGLLLGLAGSLALSRLLESELWNVTTTDPLTFTAVSLFLALVALVACVIPTRHATRVDPAVAVRAE